MKKVTDLTVNEVINCKTKEEAIAITRLMNDALLTWVNNHSYED